MAKFINGVGLVSMRDGTYLKSRRIQRVENKLIAYGSFLETIKDVYLDLISSHLILTMQEALSI
jgi:hypothetical protein